MKQYKIKKTILNKDSISIDLYLKDIRKYPLLSEEEEIKLFNELKSGNETSKNKLISSNLRFVVSIAKQYKDRCPDLMDLISAGNEGLLKAVDRFDTSKGIRFISYAVWWIRDAILREIIEQNRPVKIPIDKIISINKLNRLISDFEQLNCRVPSSKELSYIMDVPEEVINDLLSKCNITVIPETIVNLDGDESSLFDSFLSESDESDSKSEQQSTLLTIKSFLKNHLNIIEYEVITKFFGIDCVETPLEVIGEQNNITKERVRQIKDKAIIKLRKSNNIEILSNLL